MKRAISFILLIAFILGMVGTPSQVLAQKAIEQTTEAQYKIVVADGKSFKSYKYVDVAGRDTAIKEEDSRNLKKQTVRKDFYHTLAVGDPIDKGHIKVKVIWTTFDLKPPTVGIGEVRFYIFDSVSSKLIAQTDPIDGNDPEKEYDFYKTADYDAPGVSYDKTLWELRIPEAVEYDIRLNSAPGGDFINETVNAIFNQKACPLYKAEYYLNGNNIPNLEGQLNDQDNRKVKLNLNKSNLGALQYKTITDEEDLYFKGKEIDIIEKGNYSTDNMVISEQKVADRWYMEVKAPGMQDFVLGKNKTGEFKDNNVPYHFAVTGSHLDAHIVTVRQDLIVKFDPNGGTWKTAAPADQTIGHSMKLGDSWAGLGPITVPGAAALNPPAVAAGEPEKEFIGWNTEASATSALFTDNTYAEPITADVTTFYAIYKEKAQGKIKVEYKDMQGGTIDAKYKLANVDYPTELPGNNGEEIKAEHLNGAPEFLGYEYKANATNPVPTPGEKATYTENGKYTLIYKYNKLDSVIPEKEGNKTNTKPTGYVTVTFKAGDNGKINGDTKDIKYFVNPKDDVTFGDTKISEPTVTPNTNYDVKDPKWGPEDFNDAKKAEKITADATFTAQYVKQKGTVTYKYNENVNTTQVQNPSTADIPAAPTDNNQYDVGTPVAAETNVKEENKVTGKSVPVEKDGVKIGQWKFSGWNPTSLTIAKGENKFTGTWTFTEEGKKLVTRKFVDADGNALPEANGEFNKFPSITQDSKQYYPGQNADVPATITESVKGTKGNEKGTWTFDGWYPGNLNATKGSPLNVKAQGTNEYLGKWVFTKENTKAVTFSFKFYNSKKPNEELTASVVSGNFDPEVPDAQTGKYVGDPIGLKTFNDVKRDKDNKGNDLGLQGTWKFDGWYKSTDTKFENKLTDADAKVSANDDENKLVGKWILTETETKEVKRVFVIDSNIMGDGKDVPTGYALPQGVKDQKPNDTENYIGSKQTPGKDKFNPVYEEINGKKGNWTFVEWKPTELTVVENPGPNDNKFTGTWTWTQATSDKPTVDQPKAEDTVIKGKGKKGSTIVVTTPDGKTHETTVGDNGDWSVTVPPVKENDKIKVEQKEKGKKTSDPVEVTVERKITYFGHFYEPSPDYLNKNVPAKKEEKAQEKYLELYRWYVKGNEMGMFMPKKGITRAEVAQMFARALEYDKAMVNVNITPYTDVDANAWYYEAVQKTSAAGIFKGSDKGTFMPTREITKAELIATIARFQHLSIKAGNTLNLQANHWATAEVEAAYQEGWLDIYTNGTAQFAADEVISREEVVTILNRAFGRIADTKYIDDNAHTMTNFSDVTKDMWSYYEIMTAANTYLVDKMWVNHATKDNGPETLKEMIEWVRPLIDNKDVREVVEQVRFQR